MIKIIKEGSLHFETMCRCCLCEFEYDLNDLNKFQAIECPTCKHLVTHEDTARYKEYKEKLRDKIVELKKDIQNATAFEQSKEIFNKLFKVL